MVAGTPRPLRVVFCGTPQFAVPALQAVVGAGHAVELVLTQPDRPSGRGLQLLAYPVKQWAVAHGIPVEQPAQIRVNEALRTRLEAIAPDAILVVAYGRIIPLWMLALPPLGNINLHGSLLPKYRGAAPVQWAVANGERVTGVTTMRLDEGLDTGPVLEHAELEIAAAVTADELFPQLAALGAPLVLSTLAGLANGTLVPEPQDNAAATHAPILTREDGRIDFGRSAQEIYNRWRGFQPWPGAWTMLDGKKFTAVRMRLPAENGTASVTFEKAEPGLLFAHGGGLYAACGSGTAVELLEVQMEGRRAMPASDFMRGHANVVGRHLG